MDPCDFTHWLLFKDWKANRNCGTSGRGQQALQKRNSCPRWTTWVFCFAAIGPWAGAGGGRGSMIWQILRDFARKLTSLGVWARRVGEKFVWHALRTFLIACRNLRMAPRSARGNFMNLRRISTLWGQLKRDFSSNNWLLRLSSMVSEYPELFGKIISSTFLKKSDWERRSWVSES